jgi:hypothetical protein
VSACYLNNLRVRPNLVFLLIGNRAQSLPLPLEEYFSESSMAGGDESDDEDLTEPDDCDSDTEGKESPYALFFD